MKKIVLLLHSLIKSFLLLIIPSLCAYCKIFLPKRTILCDECDSKIFPIVSTRIDITAHVCVTVFALSDYKDPLKKLVLAKRWSDPIASYGLAQLLWEKTMLSTLDYDIITSIPLHWTRYASRGFNQAQEMAQVIAHKRKVPVVHLLKRVKKTAFQFELAASSRGTNVKNAFELCIVDTQRYKNKHILLVDDLMTTGATIREAAKELLKLQPRKITVVVACRVI